MISHGIMTRIAIASEVLSFAKSPRNVVGKKRRGAGTIPEVYTNVFRYLHHNTANKAKAEIRLLPKMGQRASNLLRMALT